MWQVCLVLSDHVSTIARAYALGVPAKELIMVARGEEGRVFSAGETVRAIVIENDPEFSAGEIVRAIVIANDP